MISQVKCNTEAERYTWLPTFGVVCLLAFTFVILSHKIAIGEFAALGALMVALSRPQRFEVPGPFWWYLIFFALGILGLPSSDYPDSVSESLIVAMKVIVVGLAAANIVSSRRDSRTFVAGYLLLFALFPVRGAIYNYINGITEAGRISWNFFFRNPNDLAISCFFPLGLCAYLYFTERGSVRILALAGIPTLLVIQLLTQSRGAVLGLGAGLLYFIFITPRKFRTAGSIAVLAILAAALAPDGVWERVGGLSKARVGGDRVAMAEVDPEGSASGRWAVMKIGLEIALENPWLGVGIGSYNYEHQRKTIGRADLNSGERGFRDTHSMYIRSAAETGVIGGIAIICYVGLSILQCRRYRVAIPQLEKFAGLDSGIAALEATMVAYSIAAIFNSAALSTYTMWQYVIPCALAKIALRRCTALG